ncbi:MAG: hypothetical protein GY906_23025 [bacterium]|nr:hypothetical protein [bacterium]
MDNKLLIEELLGAEVVNQDTREVFAVVSGVTFVVDGVQLEVEVLPAEDGNVTTLRPTP